MKVSVVMAFRNAGAYLRDSIRSVLGQTYPNVELIVVDDGSTDESPQTAGSFGPVLTYVRQENRGASAARNEGVQRATGEYVTFFDGDDLMAADNIASQADFIQRQPACSAVVNDYQTFTEQGDSAQTHFQTCPSLERIGLEEFLLSGLEARAILSEENFAITNSILMRRDVLNRIGGFDKELVIGEDWELLYRAAIHGPIGLQRKVGCRKRVHESNLSTSSIAMHQGQLKSREKVLTYERDAGVRRKLRRYLGKLHLLIGERRIGFENGRAVLDLIRSLAYVPFGEAHVTKLGKILLTLAGLRKPASQRSLPGLVADPER